ncbi:hypothetical protein PSP6_210190 [Paraburkholderia tropica]|nr:hypothetical protein PSP6_210190 [Paraburkholderia tropica]
MHRFGAGSDSQGAPDFLIPPKNVASLALANKLSYVITNEIIYRDRAMLLLHRRR